MTRVMIVEDEPITAADLEQQLDALGYEVAGSFDTGEDALARAPELAPDLVLMDIHLRGRLNGIEAARALRARRELPIVFLTAFGDQATVSNACETQPYGYILKPFDERSLAAALQVALTRARVDREQLERERFMSAALQNDALVAVDEQATIRFMNEAAGELLGLSSDATGQDARAVLRFAPAQGADTAHPLERALRDGEVTAAPERTLLTAQQGAPLRVAYSAAPVRGPAGAHLGAVMVFRALAPAANAAAPGRGGDLNKLKAELAHELNNPLTYNLSALNLALQELDQLRAMHSLAGMPDDAQRLQREQQLVRIEGLLRDARQGAARIADVMRDASSFSDSEVELTPIRPTELLDLALGLCRSVTKNVRLTRTVTSAPMIRGNKWLLSRVLAHALENALDALDPLGPGGIALEAFVSADARSFAQIELRTRGTRRAFSSATAASNAGSDVALKPGTSLALPQHILESCGARLAIRERPDGHTLELLLAPLRVSQHLAADVAQRGSVLVIDDEPMIGRVLQLAVQREHDVTVVQSAQRALELLERGDAFDVILCDLCMPGMGGAELYEQLRQSRPEIAARMLFMTGGAATETAARFLEQMAGRRIQKPFQIDLLLELLRTRVAALRNSGVVAKALA